MEGGTKENACVKDKSQNACLLNEGRHKEDEDMFTEKLDHVTSSVEKLKFSSTFSTYMTLLGFSLGMSDFWRFPFLAYRNGGGAFLIPFMVMIALCGFPLYFLEYSLAKFSGKGPYKIWDICPLFRGIGVTVAGAYSLWMIGTTVLRCWIIDFLLNCFQSTLPWTHCDNLWNTPHCRDSQHLFDNEIGNQSMTNQTSFYILHLNQSSYPFVQITDALNDTGAAAFPNITVGNETGPTMSSAEEYWQYRVLQLSSGMSDLSPIQWRHVASLAIIRIVICFGLVKSIKSIEKIIYVTATIPFFLTVAIFIRSLMLPGSTDGLLHFITPEFSKIVQPRVWIEATLMAFYTLSFGWGGNMLLGSHAHFHQNSVRTAFAIPLITMVMSMFSGLVCFSVIGNMAYINRVDFTDVVNAGMSTGIVAYITALSNLPLPQVWTVFYLAAVILTGIDGQLVPMDMVMQLIGDLVPKLKAGFRIQALVVIGVLFFLFSLPTCTGAGAYIFLWIDWYNGAWIGPVIALIELIVVAWVYGMDRFDMDVKLMIGSNIPGLIRISIAFVAPAVVLVIFFTSIVEYVPPEFGSYRYTLLARGLGWLTVAVGISPMVIQAVSQLFTVKGSFYQKLTTSVKPLKEWGPCESEYFHIYRTDVEKFRERTFAQLFYYNIMGNYPQ